MYIECTTVLKLSFLLLLWLHKLLNGKYCQTETVWHILNSAMNTMSDFYYVKLLFKKNGNKQVGIW